MLFFSNIYNEYSKLIAMVLYLWSLSAQLFLVSQ